MIRVDETSPQIARMMGVKRGYKNHATSTTETYDQYRRCFVFWNRFWMLEIIREGDRHIGPYGLSEQPC